MTVALVVVIQITLVLALANVAARWAMSRAPQLAAAMCSIGFVMALAVILLTVIPIPRMEMDLLNGSAAYVMTSSDQEELTAGKGATRDRHVVPASNSRGVELRRLWQPLMLGEYREKASSRRVVWFCLLVWGILVGLGVVRTFISALTVLQIRQRRREIHIPRLDQSLAAWQSEHHDGASLKLFNSEHVDSPCVIWLDRGAIYVPESFAEWSEEEQLSVVAHEAAHLLRSDAQWRLFASSICQFLNFHPLAWLLKRQLVLAQELAADRRASELLSVVAYRRGLCQLALRMDLQFHASFVSFGVSVSTNSLVRRIKVLSSLKSKLSRWQHYSAVTLLIGGSLSVAVWTVHADDTIRIASRSTQPATPPADWFARGASHPWDEVGNHEGYFQVLLSTIAQKAETRTVLDGIAEGLGIGDLDCGVRMSRDLESWVSNFGLNLKEVPEKDRRDDHRYALSLNADKLVLQFSRDVDWGEVAEKVNWRTLVGPDHAAIIGGLLKEQGTSKTLRLVSAKNSVGSERSMAKSLWPVVDGGATTLVFPLAGASKISSDYNSDNALMVTWFGVACNCRYVGIGVDCDNDATTCQLRLALVPNQGQSTQELLKQVEAAIATTLASLQEDSASSEVERQKIASWRSFIEDWRVSTLRVDATIEEVVVTEGPVDANCLLLPTLQ